MIIYQLTVISGPFSNNELIKIYSDVIPINIRLEKHRNSVFRGWGGDLVLSTNKNE